MSDAVAEPKRGSCEPQPATPGLHVVATPIGNLGDISARALDTLSGVDIIACEDSRVTGKLLKAYGIATKTKPYHDHNAESVRPWIIKQIQQGKSVALVSDAGTPVISDPGYKLVRAVIDSGLPVTALPGPMAAVTALVLSGLPADRFLFAGFLPNKAAARRSILTELKGVPATLIFYESTRRLGAALGDMVAILGPREGAVARELTKLFEHVVRGPLTALQQRFEASPPKGEIVILVAPPDSAAETMDEAALETMLREALQTHSLRDAATAVAAATAQPRRKIYEIALRLRDE